MCSKDLMFGEGNIKVLLKMDVSVHMDVKKEFVGC